MKTISTTKSNFFTFAFISFFFLCCSLPLHAQILRGKIVNKKNEPIPNSSIYIHELSQGLIADQNGQFQMKIPVGTYRMEFRSLGYKTSEKAIEIPTSGKEIRIELEEKIYDLQEVVVYARDEDPAYRVMRRVIAYAPFYRNQIEAYQSETYTKGTFHIDKIPRLLRSALKKNDQGIDFKKMIGKTYVMESNNEITFSAPNRYTQRVKALKSSIPKEIDMSKNALSAVTSNIYTLNVFSPGAFRYYTFKLEDVEYSNERIVNKIKVTPRRKNGELYSGYIYILENSWNIYGTDLSSTQMGSTMRLRTTFHEVEPSVYLPTTYDASLDANTFGIKAGGRYFVSVIYKSVKAKTVPSTITGTVVDTDDTPSLLEENRENRSPKKQKAIKKIEKLSQKERLSTKESYQLAKLMKTASETEEERRNRESLEIKELNNITINVDSAAFMVDSTYWEKVRIVPLQAAEQKSYAVADSLYPPDSIARFNDGPTELVISVGDGDSSTPNKLLYGGQFKIDDKRRIGLSGLLFAIKEYNFVDELYVGQSFNYTHAFDTNRYITVKPSLYYTTARKALRWETEISMRYAPMRLGYFRLAFGHKANDIKQNFGNSRFLNSITSALYGKNVNHFYDSKFLHLANSIDIANGLNLTLSLDYEKRQPLENLASWNLFKKEVSAPNILENWHADFPIHDAAICDVLLTYRPRYRYKIEGGKKQYVSSVYPTFYLNYRKGLNLSDQPDMSTFDMVGGGVRQTLKTSLFSKLNYSLSGGHFFNRKAHYLPDYKFFVQNPIELADKSFDKSFSLLPPYVFSNHFWTEAHINYTSDYLLFKNLPFLQSMPFDESLHLHFLHVDGIQTHLEGGYSVGISGLTRVGIFTSFDGKKINGVALRVSLPFLFYK